MVVSKLLLRTIPLFASLSDEQLDAIVKSSQTVTYDRDVVLFHEGDPGESLFIVISGRVKVCLLGDGGQEIILATLGPQNYLGEMALLDGSPRSASAVTLEPSTLLKWNRGEFLGRVLKDQTLTRAILTHLVKCLRQANDQIRTMAMFDIHGRIVRALLRLAHERGTRQDTRIVIDPRPSQQMLAHMVGCQRETISRAMQSLKRSGYIRVAKRALVVEEQALRRYWTMD